MNNKHRKTLEILLADPINGNIDWARIESLLIALGCRVIEGPGSAVTFEFAGHRANFHRPHPAKEALRYRVKAVREFLDKTGASA
jgi:HicA toxin of bacterial toxin-antitoxin,